MIENKTASRVWSALLNNYPHQNGRWASVWNKLAAFADGIYSGSTVSLNIHGQKTYLNYGHAYPIFSRRFKDWNNPLIEAVWQIYELLGRPIDFVDVGAGIGDTARLLQANCPKMIRHFHCIEGDLEFYNYLAANLDSPDAASIYKAMLSSNNGEISSLVRHHSGSSASQGPEKVLCTTLDNLLSSRKEKIHLIKIDVDGLDGQILAGSREILASDKSAVIFEWHPILCKQAGYSWLEHFEVLSELDYTRYIWFNKYGNFSHFMTGFDKRAIEQTANVCLGGLHDDDWHYDVIALPSACNLSDVALANLPHARHRKSWY